MIRRMRPRRRRGRWITVPDVTAVEPGDPILLPDAAGNDVGRDAPTCTCNVVLVADDID